MVGTKSLYVKSFSFTIWQPWLVNKTNVSISETQEVADLEMHADFGMENNLQVLVADHLVALVVEITNLVTNFNKKGRAVLETNADFPTILMEEMAEAVGTEEAMVEVITIVEVTTEMVVIETVAAEEEACVTIFVTQENADLEIIADFHTKLAVTKLEAF